MSGTPHSSSWPRSSASGRRTGALRRKDIDEAVTMVRVYC
jgi:hypothetical protein